MEIEARLVEYADVQAMRELYRNEQQCQIITDSLLRRELADPYLILVDGRVGGYGAVRTKYDPGRLMEFYTVPRLRGSALPMFRELLAASGATHIQAQTNMPLMLLMLTFCAEDIAAHNILFDDVFQSRLECPAGEFRHSEPDDGGPDPEADWVIEANGEVVAAGGFSCHYNPPYGDIYMAVIESARRKGFGSYFVQEAKRVCYEAGRRPAARCNAENTASRLTLQKAGMLPCGRLLEGRVAASALTD